eukprot:2839543-Pleurochrysis_carterae.AAC.3
MNAGLVLLTLQLYQLALEYLEAASVKESASIAVPRSAIERAQQYKEIRDHHDRCMQADIVVMYLFSWLAFAEAFWSENAECPYQWRGNLTLCVHHAQMAKCSQPLVCSLSLILARSFETRICPCACTRVRTSMRSRQTNTPVYSQACVRLSASTFCARAEVHICKPAQTTTTEHTYEMNRVRTRSLACKHGHARPHLSSDTCARARACADAHTGPDGSFPTLSP